MNTKKFQRGVGLIEVLIAAIVFAVGIAAVVQLQGRFFQSSGAANARSIATTIAEEKLEDLRGFQVTDSSDADIFDFTSISGDGAAGGVAEAGGRCTEQVDDNACTLALPAGNVTQDNITFNRTWSVTNYYYNAGALTTVANGDVVQKLIRVTVSWTDADGSPQNVALNTVINKFSGAATTGLVASNVGGSGEKPIVSYTPSTDSHVTPIGVGTDTKRETLVPASQTVGGYTRTKFTAYTYNDANKLIREEEFQNVACDCRFDGSSTDADKTYAAAHPEWSNDQGTYIDAEGDKVSGKVKGCVQGGGANCDANPDDLCNACCRDHHDISSVSRKYDPFRSSDDFTVGGDHKHYSGTTPVTSGQYLEACRMKRVNGFWRVYQDWHMADLTVLPLSDLIDDNPNPPPEKIKDIYAGYVKNIIDEHLDENKVAGEVLSSPPTKPAILDHTTANNYVTMTVDDKRDLTGRAIYLDYIDSTHLTKVKDKKAAGQDYLLHLPFYEIEVAQVAGWNSADVAKVKVGPYDGPGTTNDLAGGQLHALANTISPVDVTGSMRKSNSGIVALSLAVDYNATTNPDSQIHSDFVKVQVGPLTDCTLPWGGTTPNNTAVTAFQAATVPFGNTCVSQQRTCTNGVLSGSYQYQTCTVNPAASCTFNGTTVLDGISVTAYQAGTVVAPAACVSESRTCSNGTLSGSYAFADCTVQTALDCTTPWGASVANGAMVVAYQAATVPFGSNCASEIRTCTNGTLAGSYTNASCTVGAPANCTFNGTTVTHGDSVTAYQAAVVIAPNTCTTETRTCDNGTLSGSYTNASCAVQASTCSSTVSGTKQGNATYSMSINGGAAIACPVTGNVYNCPTQTVNISGTTIVITSSSGTTKSFISPNVCGALTANF